jgi:type IX secretion system PorP/SprF family membrane protein
MSSTFRKQINSMKSIHLLTFTLLIFISLKTNAQDVHFSQFWNTPLLQNASFAGKSGANIRAIVNHKSQWGSVTTNPFKSYGVNLDMRLNGSSKDNFFGGGISMYTDVAGASNMRTTLVNLAAAYHIKIDNKNFISGGLQAGFNQKNIDNTDLRFDNQFDGAGHNSGLSSNENLTNLSEIKPTASAGISYMWSNAFGKASNRAIKGKKEINIGLAVHHFNSPRFNFVQQEKLGLKYIASFEGSFNDPSTPWTIKPAAFIALQSKASDIVFGSLFEYTLNESSQITDLRNEVSIAFGGYYRFKDALIPTFQVRWNSFDIGFSYDVNLSQLSGASQNNGGFEISLKYCSLPKRKSGARFF